MPPRRIADELRACIVRMSLVNYPTKVVATLAGVSQRSVRSIVTRWEETGDVSTPAQGAQRISRRRALQDYQYLIRRVCETPDMYLDEMQRDLAAMCNVEVSIPTIWRTLRRAGFTRKKVCL
ncbi:hypothetical protein BDV93DRAFT_444896 [Ceratobasidium sp. AG-I]|nr:hypothetical protein BDV93DRAFT_444896 [Ceratobasidium sp. AG-I]